VLVLRPGPAPAGTLVEEPPDGTMLAFCGWVRKGRAAFWELIGGENQ